MSKVYNKQSVVYFCHVQSIDIINSGEYKMRISNKNSLISISVSHTEIVFINDFKLIHFLTRYVIKTELIKEYLTTFEFVFRIY